MAKRFLIRISRIACGLVLLLVGFGFVVGGATFAWRSTGNLDFAWNPLTMLAAPMDVAVGIVFSVLGLGMWAWAVMLMFTSDSVTSIWSNRVAT